MELALQTIAKNSRRVSLADIGRLAEVSVTTVSRVLSGQPGPSPSTRKTVLDAAGMLGYAPNAIARAMSTSHSQLIGIAVADLEDPFFTEMLDGAQAQARSHGFHLLVASSRRDPRIERSLIDDFRGYRVEGMVLAGTPHRDLPAERAIAASLAALDADGIPVVQVGVRRGPAPLLRIDFAGLAADATRHLLGLGHRRIGYISDESPQEIRDLHRSGMTAALNQAGIMPDSSLLVEWTNTEDPGPVLQLIERGATAILGADDLIAVAIFFALRNLGLSIPSDISVMGMDGTQLPSQILQPALSTVALPVKAMGEQAIEEIVRVINGGEPHYATILPHQVVARESTAPPQNPEGQLQLRHRQLFAERGKSQI